MYKDPGIMYWTPGREFLDPEILYIQFRDNFFYLEYGVQNKSKQIENIQNDYSTYVGHFEFDKTISV